MTNLLAQMAPPADLQQDEIDALQKLHLQLAECHERNLVRSAYYNTLKTMDVIGFSIPPALRELQAVLGWPAKTVDSLSSRLNLDGFVDKGKSSMNEDLEEIWDDNRMTLEWPQAQVSTFVHGCSFVAVTPGDTSKDEPEVLIQTMPATEATGIWDVRRKRLESALWVPEVRASEMFPELGVLFLPNKTVTMSRVSLSNGSYEWKIERIPNKLPRIPVTPLTYRSQLGRPYGQSRINNAVTYLVQLASRTMMRTEVSAEFYSSPQRYAMGADADSFQDENGQPISPWETLLGKVWLLGRDEDGNIPEVGQFPQMTMMPHVDMMRAIATMFAAETSMPVSSLGIVHDNPASAEAIDAAWADMVGVAEQCQTELGYAATEIAQNALMVSDSSTDLKKVRGLRPKWRDASTPTRAAMADAVTKQVAAGILQPDSEIALEQLGYDETDISRIKAEHEKAKEEAKQNDPLAGLGGLLDPRQALPQGGDPNAPSDAGSAQPERPAPKPPVQ